MSDDDRITNGLSESGSGGSEQNDEGAEDYEFPPPRRRRPLALVVVIVLVAALVGGGLAVAFTRGGGGLGLTPAPTATLFPGENLFYINIDPYWGTVSIDGHAIASLPTNAFVIGKKRPKIVSIDGHAIASLPTIGFDTPLALSPGEHTVMWNASPFKQQACVVYVPPQPIFNGACAANDSVIVQSGPDEALPATVISFVAFPSMLSVASLSGLFHTTQAFLDSLSTTDIVQPGEQFVDIHAGHTITTATQPLRATLRYHLDTNPKSTATCIAVGAPGFTASQSCEAYGGNCYTFCREPGSYGGAVPTESGLNVYGVVKLTWDYTTVNGQVVAADQPDASNGQDTEYLMPFTINWNGKHWSASSLAAVNSPFASANLSPLCISAEAVLQGSQSQSSNFSPQSSPFATVKVKGQIETLYWLRYVSGKNTAEGCLAGASLSSTGTPVAYLLDRFGVLIAANALVHRYWPNFPTADTYEQHIVQQLMP